MTDWLDHYAKKTWVFTALKYKIEFGSALSDSAKQKLEQQKESIKGKVEDKLRSKLLGDTKEEVPATGAAPAEGAKPEKQKPEDKVKEKLKKLF